MTTPPIPTIEKALLDHLKAAFQHEIENPRVETSPWDVGFRAGKRHLIEYLERVSRDQQKKAPVTHVLQQT